MHFTIQLGLALHGHCFVFLYAVSRRGGLGTNTLRSSCARPHASHSRTTLFRACVRFTPERWASSWPTAWWSGGFSFSRSPTCTSSQLSSIHQHPRVAVPLAAGPIPQSMEALARVSSDVRVFLLYTFSQRVHISIRLQPLHSHVGDRQRQAASLGGRVDARLALDTNILAREIAGRTGDYVCLSDATS